MKLYTGLWGIHLRFAEVERLDRKQYVLCRLIQQNRIIEQNYLVCYNSCNRNNVMFDGLWFSFNHSKVMAIKKKTI